MIDPADFGAKVLAGFDKGRARAIEVQREQGAETLRKVRRAIDLDVLAGNSETGRARRIARRVNRSERQVKRVMARLMSLSAGM